MSTDKKRFSADGPAPRQRFWKEAGVQERADGFTITLDGKSVRLPGGNPLCVTARPLAEALAAEWAAAGLDDPKGRFTPADLPLTRIAGTKIERVRPEREHIIATLADYGAHDLLCYRAETEGPLTVRQAEEWQPWLDWLNERHGITLRVTHGMMPIKQPEPALQRLRTLLATRNDADLAALGVAVPALGSLVLGLALADGAITPAQAVAAASVDERVQMERWGEDAAILDRIAAMNEDVMDAARFMELGRR
ncbi:ATP12 family chaperone protein [Acetobacter estunensis]|uniref:ATP12 family chaperone protein n=1 Tax=Acetobacter estunensis TaxID=104097 RepID=UPI001C2D7936|nr:ATP12 family protein [Acetobacter estunensis]MBV1838048.1 hypothetical protein [Acetobacter estunensis]